MISVELNGKQYQVEQQTTIEKLLEKLNLTDQQKYLAAVFNNQIYSLNAIIDRDGVLKLLSRGDETGNRIYKRSLFLLLARAVNHLFPGGRLSIEHSLSNGIYCELHKDSPLSSNDLTRLEKLMKELVQADLPITRKMLSREKALELLAEQGLLDKIELVKQCGQELIPLDQLDNYSDYFHYQLAPSTGLLDKFKLHYRLPGFILLFPQKEKPDLVPDFVDQPKLATVFQEFEKLGDILEVGNVSELNNFITGGEYGELIRISEALHEKKIGKIADQIYNNIKSKRVILIAGPSSSGKTTFSYRLSTQLRINGLKPVAISLDDYFVNRDQTPLDSEGNLDFEAIEAINLELLNEHLVKLLQGGRVEIPTFNFQKGISEYKGKYLQIKEDQPIILEGIHGLNDRLTRFIPQDQKFKIYVSALTQLNIDSHNRIPTTDTRLIRRIIRDHHYRGHPAEMTIDWWPGVRRGEEKNIFPYQENADIMFNSALIYELAVLKKYAVPLLQKIERRQKSFLEASRLLEMLNCFKVIPDEKQIPGTSILREFIGDSIFR